MSSIRLPLQRRSREGLGADPRPPPGRRWHAHASSSARLGGTTRPGRANREIPVKHNPPNVGLERRIVTSTSDARGCWRAESPRRHRGVRLPCDPRARGRAGTTVFLLGRRAKNFVWAKPLDRLPINYAMFSADGDAAVADAVNRFLRAAIPTAEASGVSPGQARLDLLQDHSITTPGGNQFDVRVRDLRQTRAGRPLPVRVESFVVRNGRLVPVRAR